MISRSSLVYGLIFAVWGLVVGWQSLEHSRVKEAARSALILRARDITGTLGLVIKSQRRWGGIVSQSRLEPALNSLVSSEALKSVALLNSLGDVVASAGMPIDPQAAGSLPQGVHWDESSVTVVNPIDLGEVSEREGDPGNRPTIVIPRSESSGNGPGERPGFPRPGRRPPGNRPPDSIAEEKGPSGEARENERRRGPSGRSRFGRPFWMNEDEFKALTEKQGLHGFVIAMSTAGFEAARTQDLWLRIVIGGFATVSMIGFLLAWRNLERSSELQMRLLRTSELNTHLREMNLAAAGLAHETRNPLNIIRGLAQMISKETGTSDEIRLKSREVTDEVDRVTAQLNEFINYSKPREIRRAPVVLSSVINDVARALKSDLEDKSIQLNVVDGKVTVDADEKSLRQVLFNLLLNAIQAVAPAGKIEIISDRSNTLEAWFEVRDDGPGVPREQRKEIFRPYVTTHQKGTGLGLAVVQQIVLAHGWDIECQQNEAQGAVFRICKVQLASRA